jgi:hypothetical protein
MPTENTYIQPNADGKAHIILEKGVIPLKDLSTALFQTDDLSAFGAFAASVPGPAAIFYSHLLLQLWPTEGVTGKTRALAACNLELSEPMALLSRTVGRPMDIVALEKFLSTMRRYGPFLSVISQLKNIVVSKETKFERQVDNAANFKLLIERKGGAGDWTPPAVLTFSAPVYAFLDDVMTVETDMVMTMKDEDGGAPTFTLEALTFKEDLKARQREILENRLGGYTSMPKYWGSHAINEATDAYLYKDNGATL